MAIRAQAFIAICLAGLPANGHGQIDSVEPTKKTQISGRVVDITGAGMSNAAVTLTRMDLHDATTGQTDENGVFTFPAVSSGLYELIFETSGFRRATVPVNRVGKGKNVGTIVMEVAEIESPFEVAYDPAPLQATLNRQTDATHISASNAARKNGKPRKTSGSRAAQKSEKPAMPAAQRN
jgi:hypothetical protein